MKHIALSVGLSLVVALSASAQVTDASIAAPAVSESARARFTALETEASEAYDAWLTDIRKRMAEAKAEGRELGRDEYGDPKAPFIPKFQDAADEYAGQENAVPFLVWLVNNGDAEIGGDAFQTVCESHARSKEIKPLAQALPYMERRLGDGTLALIAKLEENSTVPEIRGWAAFTRLSPVISEADLDSPDYKLAKTELVSLVEAANDKRLTSQVDSKLNIREKFSIGMVAPDIAGIDLDGTEFALSDYEGKVLFVDFWGDW